MKYINLKDGQTITGKFVGFSRGKFGVNLILIKDDEEYSLSIKNVVLKNIIRRNINKFVKGCEVTITRVGLEKDRYILYKVYINGKDLSNNSLSLEDVIDLLK